MSREIDPVTLEKRTRNWPVRIAPLMTFAEADAAEEKLKREGRETARICWGGQLLEVRGK